MIETVTGKPTQPTNRAASNPPLRVLRVDSSSRYDGSVTRALGDHFVDSLRRARDGAVQVTRRDVAQGLPFINEAWIGANFARAEERTTEQIEILAQSNSLVRELQEAEVVVLTVPVYNFGVPATLKAWIDLVARAGLTFRYTADGPEGLLRGKRAYVMLASGGTPIGGAIDFASSYLRHVMGFIGIKDVTILGAERLNAKREVSLAQAKQDIENAVAALQRQSAQAA